MLAVLAASTMAIPSLAHEFHAPAAAHSETLSLICAGVLLVLYVVTLPSFLRSTPGEEHVPARWTTPVTAVILAFAGAAAAFTSDWFVTALTPAIHTLHMSEEFAGLVIVAIAGNAVENVVGIQLAARNKMDFAVSVIVNSSLQIALVLTPVLVFVSLLFTTHLTLVFPTLLALVLLLAGILGALIVNDGESTWQEGAVLVGFYVVIAASFWWGRSRSTARASGRVGGSDPARCRRDVLGSDPEASRRSREPDVSGTCVGLPRATLARPNAVRASRDVRRDRSECARQLDEVLRRSSICRPRLPALTRIVSHVERALVDGGRQPLALAERADPADDVPGRALGERTVGELRALARGAQVELPVGRHDEHAQRVRHRRDERLEELRRVAPEGARHRDRVVAVVDVDAFVLVQAELDAGPLRGLDRRRHSASSSASSASANSRHASVDVGREEEGAFARDRQVAHPRDERVDAACELLAPLLVVEIRRERLDGPVVHLELAPHVSPGCDEQQRAPPRPVQLGLVDDDGLPREVREHRQRVAERSGVHLREHVVQLAHS